MGSVQIVTNGYKLAGTLSVPENPNGKSVLILPGSGGVDQDGNHKKFPSNLYKDLSDKLNHYGFTTLRFHKRGVGESEGSYIDTGFYDFINDAREWLRFLKSHTPQNKVFILGHSEGALQGPAVLNQEPADGLIFLCGSTQNGKDLLKYQNRLVRKEIREVSGFKGLFFKMLKVDQKIEKQSSTLTNKINHTDESSFRFRGAKINAKWIREQSQYDVKDELKRLNVPVLAISGGKDVQVEEEAAARVKELVHGPAVAKVLKDMNHVLRRFDGDHSLLKLHKEYRKTFPEDIHPELMATIIEWLDDPALSKVGPR
ncbi:alpha/beta fold hydrolase [Halobacillus fulvus]|nr:alpha/beta fold hydrolase [Halobacillus fulvus]